MAYPDDLDDVAVFKIHPAIGVARLANNDDLYEFFEYEQVRNEGRAQELRYMTVQNGNHWIMRQAVQYKIFAYAADGGELGELSADIMDELGVTCTWTASVANRKLTNWNSSRAPVEASGSADQGQTVRLEGENPFRAGKVWLGDLTGDGLFIPPKGGVHRESQYHEIPPYGSHDSDNGVLDTTSDGAISASITGAAAIPVIPACIIVAPQQHSPDVNPGDIDDGRNKSFVSETRRLLGIREDGPLPGEGYAMDIAMMNTINAEYSPGMEVCLNRGSTLDDPEGAFYPRGVQNIADNEIRPNYEAGGAVHGALTAGLCSVWQTDLNACLNYWTAEFPNELVYDDEPEDRFLSRKDYASAGPQMKNNEDLNTYMDMMGIGRDLEGDPGLLFGTERDNNDDAGDTPEAPFPLEPPQ